MAPDSEIVYVFNHRGVEIPQLELPSNNGLIVLTDHLQTQYEKRFLAVRADAVRINDSLFDISTGIVENPTLYENFYHIPIITTEDPSFETVFKTTSETFSRDGTRRILVEYKGFSLFYLIDVNRESATPERVKLSSTPIQSIGSNELKERGIEGQRLLQVILEETEKYQAAARTPS
tara:strand:+ start:217 stop:747 length:531 start_codon:yes stop_codon:yes gene_type:complete